MTRGFSVPESNGQSPPDSGDLSVGDVWVEAGTEAPVSVSLESGVDRAVVEALWAVDDGEAEQAKALLLAAIERMRVPS